MESYDGEHEEARRAFIGGPVVADARALAGYKTETFAPMPRHLPACTPRIHNLVARTLFVFEDPLLQESKMALQFCPGYVPWMTTAFMQEFESARGASSNISVLMFKSGSMSATGASSLLTVLLQMALVAQEMEHFTGSRVHCGWKSAVLQTDLIVCETILPWTVSRARVATGPETTWNTRQFPGAFIKVPYRAADGELSVLVYDDRFIVAGTKTWEEACAISAFMLHYLEQFRADAPEAPRPKRRRR